MSDAIFSDTQKKMTNAIEAMKRELSKLRAGKATPALEVVAGNGNGGE